METLDRTNMSVNVLLLMVIAGAIAAIGIATNALPERDLRFAAALRYRDRHRKPGHPDSKTD